MNHPLFIIIKDIAQIQAARSIYPDRRLKWLITNPVTYEKCRALHEDSLLLDERSVRNEYRTINRFAYDTAIRLADEERDLKKRFFLETHFFDLRTLFIRILKSLFVFEQTAAAHSINALAIFEDSRSVLGRVVAFWAAQNNVEFSVIPALSAANRPSTARIGGKKAAGSALTHLTNFLSRAKFNRQKGKRIIASGSLKHFSPVLNKLSKSSKIIFLENHFNFEKFRYCHSRGMGFEVLRSRGLDHPFKNGCPFPAGSIVYQKRDISELCGNIFSAFDLLGFLNCEFDESHLIGALARLKPDAILLDEDIAIRRTMLIAAELRGIPVFVIPHGVPIIWTLGENEASDRFCKSGLLVVNSEFEKFANRGVLYDPARVVVTGTPRYDRILEFKRSAIKRSGSATRVLYCGAIIQPYDLDGFSVLSSLMGQRNLARDFMEIYLKDLVAVLAAKKSVLMKIKPHYAEESEWENLLRPLTNGQRHQVVSHREDILELVSEADIVVTTPSSVICEAVLLEKPVIVLDYESNGMSAPYAAAGIVRAVHNFEELQRALDDCLDRAGSMDAFAQNRLASGKYFTGAADGCNSQRVAALILKAIL